jgi:hypothetical protein
LNELSSIIAEGLSVVDPDQRDRFESFQERISTLQTENSNAYQLDLIATSDKQVLVDDPNDARFSQKARAWLTKSITPNYRKYLAELTSGLADDAIFLKGISKIIVRRLAIVVSSQDVTGDDKSRYLIMGCALSDYIKGDKSKITPALLQELLGALRSEHAPCARATNSKFRKQ